MSDISGVSLMNTTVVATSGRTPSNELGRDAFLKLLVAQLRFQNPLSPTDPTEFMSQTAQFTMVEKLEELADQAKASSTAQKLATASSLMGREIGYQAPDGSTARGTVTSARIDADGVRLRVGVTEVALDQVTSIGPAPARPG